MVLSKRADEDLASLLCALSFATGVGFGGHMEHGLGSAYLGLLIADELGLVEEERAAIFYGALLKDSACTACSAGIAAFFPDGEQVQLADVILLDPSNMGDMVGWLSKYVRMDAQFPARIAKLFSFIAQCGSLVKETMRSHCEVAEVFARQLGFSSQVQQTLRFQWERWDGRGMAYGLKGASIPRTACILHLAQVMDLMYRMGGGEAAQGLAREKRGSRFDPSGVDAFFVLTQRADFWSTFEAQSTQEALLALRPQMGGEDCREAGSRGVGSVEELCAVLGEFVDLKQRETWHHSEVVAEIAVNIGRCMSLSTEDLSRLRCAGYVHDIGKVAIPLAILAKGEARTASEQEMYRLHPYYTQRILERVDVLRDLAPAAASHHEWVNGQGYHRQLSGAQIPLHGRILALADEYARLMQQQKDEKGGETVVHMLKPRVGTQFDSSCYDALIAAYCTGEAPRPSSTRTRKVGNLTEREVEVLCLLARGMRTPQIARELTISRKTVEHHVAHIYNKIGVTCQTAAAVYAVQNGLV